MCLTEGKLQQNRHAVTWSLQFIFVDLHDKAVRILFMAGGRFITF